MRILHTADWHLADRLGRIDRTDDLRRAVERVADYCREEAVDVLLVAGDLFSELAGAEALRETIRHWQEVFQGFVRSGGTILTLTGNHDKESFCQTLRHAMNLASPEGSDTGLVPAGRLYLATEPTLLQLGDRATGGRVQFVLMPYPTPTRYLTDEASQRYEGLDEKNRHLLAAFTRKVHEIKQDPAYDPALPSVLAAHIHVRGSRLSTLYRLTEQEDIVFDDAEVTAGGFAYVALGHIHRSQCIAGLPHVRYSGSIERMDLGERDDEKGVVVFDIGPEGLVGEPRTLPMEATPVYEVEVRSPSVELPELRQRYPDAHRHLVKIVCTYTAGVDNREEVLRQLEEIFPRWYDREISESGALQGSLTLGEPVHTRSFQDTVRDYLQQELLNHPDALRNAVLSKAEVLIREVEGE
jgi:exonuclease SbcD